MIEEPIPINDARAMLGRYGRGMKLNAWYDPQSPGKSSLIGKLVTETRSAEVVSDTKRNVDVRGPVAISGLMTLGGFALVVFGFIGKRRKAIIPSFGGDGSAQPVKKRGSKAPVVEVPAETPVAAPDWSSLSSAKYFNDQPSGMLD